MNEHPLAEVIDQIGSALVEALSPLGIEASRWWPTSRTQGTRTAPVSVVGNMPTNDAQELLRDCADRMSEATLTNHRVM